MCRKQLCIVVGKRRCFSLRFFKYDYRGIAFVRDGFFSVFLMRIGNAFSGI